MSDINNQNDMKESLSYLQISLNLWPATHTAWNGVQCDGMRRTNH